MRSLVNFVKNSSSKIIRMRSAPLNQKSTVAFSEDLIWQTWLLIQPKRVPLEKLQHGACTEIPLISKKGWSRLRWQRTGAIGIKNARLNQISRKDPCWRSQAVETRPIRDLARLVIQELWSFTKTPLGLKIGRDWCRRRKMRGLSKNREETQPSVTRRVMQLLKRRRSASSRPYLIPSTVTWTTA